MNYVSRRLCAVEGSSLNIFSNYTHSDFWPSMHKEWYKIERSGEGAVKLTGFAGRLEYHDNMNGCHLLRIKRLKKNDSAEYAFIYERQHDELRWRYSDSPGVTLVVTGNSLD